MIVIDGSMGEAGGQILRTALAFSAVLKKPIKITNIRAKRPTPGLKTQHLEAVNAIVKITQGQIKGNVIGSNDIVYHPGEIRGGDYTINIRTAGSISLIIQALLPIISISSTSTTIRIMGGTDVKWAPPIDYIRYITLPLLQRIGVKSKLDIIQRGHYPKGGGEVRLSVNPNSTLIPIKLTEKATYKTINGLSHCVRLPSHVAQRQAAAAKQYLQQQTLYALEYNIQLETYEPNNDPHIGPGSGITLWSTATGGGLIGGNALGARGLKAEKVGRIAASNLLSEIQAEVPIDIHMADMLIPWLALIDGESTFLTRPLSSHSQTNIELVQKLTQRKFQVINTDHSCLVTCLG